jgi:uncharacterized phage protein gp47/JayE
MPRFEPKTFKTFLKRITDRVVARTALTDLEEGGAVHTIASGVARELDDISYQMTNLRRIWSIDTAEGEDLDDRARDISLGVLSRNGAGKAIGNVVFSRAGTAGTIVIPVGTVVRVPAGGPEFATTAAGTILAGFTDSAAVPIAASVPGAGGNVDGSTIAQMDAVTGVETVTNGAPTAGGQDQELDAAFRARIKAYVRSLPRGTPPALRFAALSASIDGVGTVISVEVLELTPPNLGYTEVYVDDGTGTIESSANNTGSPETVVASASGGEQRFFVVNKPIKPGTTFTLEINAVPQVEGVDYALIRSRGQIELDSGVYPTGLTVGDAVTAEYTWFTGLLALVQKHIEGDPGDRINFPGYRAAGTIVSALPPTVLQQLVTASVVVETAFVGQATEIRAAVKAAISRYINGLGINGDVILTELTFQAQSVEGVFDVSFTSPTGNVVIGDGELARVLDSNITIS